VRRRLILTASALIAMLLIALEVPFALSHGTNEFQSLTITRLNDSAAFAVEATAALRDHRADAELGRHMRDYQARTGAVVVLFDRTGTVVDSSGPRVRITSADQRARLARALAGVRSATFDHTSGVHAAPLFIAEPVERGTTVLGAVATISPVHTLRAHLLNRLLAIGVMVGATLAIAVLLAGPLSRWILRPVSALADAAEAVAVGDYEVRVSADTGPLEIRRLSRAFNTMANRLVMLMRAQQGFVADASHELRRPLTALRLRLENLEETAEPESRGEIAEAVRETRRFGGILDALLQLADAEGREVAVECVDVQAISRERAEAWRAVASDREARITLDATPATASSSPEILAQVLDVLLDNAVHHTAMGSEIRIGIIRSSHAITVHVADQGPGMTDGDKARAPDRFWRGTAPADQEGSGLGLSIAETLLASVGGRLSFGDVVPCGLMAAVHLPPWPRAEPGLLREGLVASHMIPLTRRPRQPNS
jgi:signal transduction histidine kinase